MRKGVAMFLQFIFKLRAKNTGLHFCYHGFFVNF